MTERNYNPKQKEKKSMEKIESVKKFNHPDLKVDKRLGEKKSETEETKAKDFPDEKSKAKAKDLSDEKSKAKAKDLSDEKSKETKKSEKKVKNKKTEAVVNEKNAPISTKYSVNLCRFIKNKQISTAIADLEDVLVQKKAVPMKGEYSHQKGIGPGKYPKASTEHFIKLLKSLSANAVANELENPVIVEAVANIGSRPSAKFGRWKRKRTHLRLIAKEKTKLNKKRK